VHEPLNVNRVWRRKDPAAAKTFFTQSNIVPLPHLTINGMEEYPGSGLSMSQLLHALDKTVDNSMAEARRYGGHPLDSRPSVDSYPTIHLGQHVT
jgi:hypothetical protein